MTRCPACSGDAPEGSRFCPDCGASLDVASATPTRTSAPGVPPPPAAARAGRLSTDPSGHGTFLPGTLLAGRYRMLGLLGRGGMGEVYRADDLKLGQAVVLPGGDPLAAGGTPSPEMVVAAGGRRPRESRPASVSPSGSSITRKSTPSRESKSWIVAMWGWLNFERVSA